MSEKEFMERRRLMMAQSRGLRGGISPGQPPLPQFEQGVKTPSIEERMAALEDKIDTLIKLLGKEDEVNTIKKLSE